MATIQDNTRWRELSERLSSALKPAAPPIAIRFQFGEAPDARPFGASYPTPNEAGRTGAVPAGCVFWIEATRRSFSTIASDHANCSVGSYTHGFIDLATAAKGDDVAAALGAGWIDEVAFSGLPAMERAPTSVTYAPLAEAVSADAVLVRISGLALMTIKDAFPSLAIEGKPQCHVIPLALQTKRPVASVGCALSRARTGMRAEELVCVFPGEGFADTVEKIEAAATLDRAMARYAGQDAQRWSKAH